MPRQFGRLDKSVTDRAWSCSACAGRHAPGAPCPPVGVWLVLSMCMTCTPRGYCRRHDASSR